MIIAMVDDAYHVSDTVLSCLIVSANIYINSPDSYAVQIITIIITFLQSKTLRHTEAYVIYLRTQLVSY